MYVSEDKVEGDKGNDTEVSYKLNKSCINILCIIERRGTEY